MPLIWPQKPVLFQTEDQYYEGGGSNGWLNSKTRFVMLAAVPTDSAKAFLDAIDGSYCSYSAFGEKGDCIDEVCADPEYPDINAPSPIGYQGDLQCGVYRPTNVISISYGFAEDQLHKNYQYHQCNEYMKLGLQGVTVVLSSDDNGVGGLCIFGPADHNFPTIFRPSFPQNCPYVLTVGSTELRHRDPTALPVEWEILEEVASAMFASGGGFSNIWNVADYQRDSVQEYYDQVEATLPFSSYNQIIINGSFDSVTRADQVYHHGGRGYPDVAAVGQNQIILWNGQWWTIGGTSLSAPLWGSMLTLINEKRIAAGRSTLGFINPVLVSADLHAR
jgi:tripeptidyl-peptidase I